MPLNDDYLRDERIRRLRARIASGTKQLVILGDAIPEYLRLGLPRPDDPPSSFKSGPFALPPEQQRDHDIALGMFIAERQHGIYSKITKWFNEADNESPRNLNDVLFLRYRALPPAASLVVRDVAKRDNGAQDQIALLISGIEARIQILAEHLEFDGQFDDIAPSLRDAAGGWPHLRSSGWIAGPVLDGYLARMRRRPSRSLYRYRPPYLACAAETLARCARGLQRGPAGAGGNRTTSRSSIMALMSQPPSPDRAGWRWIVQVVCGPYVILPALAIVTVVGSLSSSSWAPWAFRIWVIVTALLAGSILAFCPPLPRLRDRSHLLGRVIWLGRFMIAAILLCLSAFIGAVAGAQVSVDKGGLHFLGTGALLRSVILIAVEFGVVVFLGWLVIDMWRLGRSRQNGIDQLVINLVGPHFAPVILTPAVRLWLMALSSPALTSISFVIVGTVFLRALPPTGLRVG